jgi:hypothetical protein
MRAYRSLDPGELRRETKHYHVVIADEEPRETERYRVVREGQQYRRVQDQQGNGP